MIELGVGELVGSITAIKVSVERSLVPAVAGAGGPITNSCALYIGNKHAADLMHTQDTMVVGPSAPTVMANTLPSSSPLPMNRCPRGCTGTRTMHQAGMPYWNVNTGMEWDAWRCTRSSRGGPVKLQPVLMASVQPHGPCGHAI